MCALSSPSDQVIDLAHRKGSSGQVGKAQGRGVTQGSAIRAFALHADTRVGCHVDRTKVLDTVKICGRCCGNCNLF